MENRDVLRGAIRLPRSSGRNERDCFVKLLSAVKPHAEQGFGFEGRFHRAGSTVSWEQLHPGPEFPETPILLEHTPGPAYGPPGRRRRDQVYILWRYDLDLRTWRELGRAMSEGWHWAVDLRPLALRALREARGGKAAQTVELHLIAERISNYLNKEFEPLEDCDRLKLVGVLHDEFAARMGA